MRSLVFSHGTRLAVFAGIVLQSGSGLLAQGGPTPPPLPDDDSPVSAAGLTEAPALEESFRPPAVNQPPGTPPPPPPLAPIPGSWITQGPGPIRFGQTENVSPNNEVAGAIHTVVAHPTDADTLYIGAVNGGVWKTTNATAASPTWVAQTDTHGSLSIGALDFDPTDGTHNTLWAGIGRFSSFASRGGARTGLLTTSNGGTTWTSINGGGSLVGKNISGLAARGATVVISVNIADSFTFGNVGIFRSTNSGASFTQIGSGSGAATGLPGGVCYDLAVDPSNNNVLYTSVVFADNVGGVNGLYKSTNLGANWTRVSSAAMDAALITGTTSNVEITVGSNGQVFAGIVNSGQLRNGGVFHSPSGNVGTWVAMDTPLVNEAGGTVGTNPRFKKDAGIPGGQGAIHFSIRADPNDADIVYIGGDRQPRGFNDAGSWPNALGASNFTGRLFRGDVGVTATGGTPSPQWEHLTHTQGAGGMSGGGTASNSSPHADSREMTFDVNGDLIEVDDGGVYRRTNPTNNTGDWLSINGNLQVTEGQAIAYDPLSDIIITGNQDTGVSQQSASSSSIWDEVSQGDGGDVAVTPNPGNGSQSIRYSSAQFLGSNALWRSVYNGSGTLVTRTFPALSPLGGAPAMTGQFYTPLEANVIDGNRLLFGGGNGIYESVNQGTSISRVSTSVVNQSVGNPMVCGGRSGGSDNVDLIYAAVGSDILKRTTNGGALTSVGGYSGGTVRGIIADNEDWMTLFAIDGSQVYQSTNGGTGFSNITGDLPSLELNSIEFVRAGPLSMVVVGTHQGVYAALNANFSEWALIGTDLPDAPVWDMQYDLADDVLVVSLLGRGAWSWPNISSILTAGPTYVLDATPDDLDVCAPGDAVFTVDVIPVMGFSDPVTLSLSGAPAGTTVSFSTNPVTPGNSSTLTISNTGAASGGSYNMQIDGLGGVIAQSDPVTLNLFTGLPDPITLISPANGTIGVSLKPALVWSADPLPVIYTVEVDDDPAFGSIDFTTVTGNTTASIGSELNPDTLHYWRVTAQNPCGSMGSGISAFVTRISQGNSPGVAIPDGNATGVSNDLVVGDVRTIADLDLALEITHNYIGDLTVTLLHVDTGTSVVVLDRPGVPASTFGSSGDNIDIILDDEASLVAENDWATVDPAYIVCGHYQPNNVLSAFDGESLVGTWRLTVTDLATPDPGILVAWGLRTEQVGEPEIVVEEPLDADLTDGVSLLDFGELLSGTTPTADLVLTIRNTGTADLTGLAASIDGTDAAEFSTTSSPATLLPGQSTTVTVTFASGSAGVKSAAFHLANNDQDESPFDLDLTGLLINQTTLQSWAGTFGLSGGSLLYDADDDGDFISLLEEYAFNLDPTVADGFDMTPGGSSGLPFMSLVSGRLRMEYLRRSGDPALIYTAQFGNEPTNLLPDGFVDATEPEAVTDVDLNFQRVIVDDSVDGTTNPIRFGRVKLEYPAPGP